jgi:5-methylcytosine-specific restriction endonuclease McrA
VLTAGSLTLDHVIPKSRGGKSTWENLVACCYPCNNRKGDRTPDEAAVKLATKPGQFGLHARHRMLAANDGQWGEISVLLSARRPAERACFF